MTEGERIKAGWHEIFTTIFDMEDREKISSRETEHISSMVNALWKRNISMERKKRKGAILKIIREWHSPSIGFHYGWSLIRWAINLLWLQESIDASGDDLRKFLEAGK